VQRPRPIGTTWKSATSPGIASLLSINVMGLEARAAAFIAATRWPALGYAAPDPDAANIGGKAERQKPGSCSEVYQRIARRRRVVRPPLRSIQPDKDRPNFPVQRKQWWRKSHVESAMPIRLSAERPVDRINDCKSRVAKGRAKRPVSEPNVSPEFRSSPACGDHVSSA